MMTYDQVRAWIYRIQVAVGLVLLYYGYTTDEEWAVWTGAINSLLGNGLAARNSSTRPLDLEPR